MYGRSDSQQQWSVHAEFTISHPRSGDQENVPQAHTEQGDNGVRMTYTWCTQANQNDWSSSPSVSNRSAQSDSNPKSYNFQKGNLLFTSTPPRRTFNIPETNINRLGVHDSGYGSDLLSPGSHTGHLQKRPIQPYNRKCRSTCNIVLSTNVQDQNRTEDTTQSSHTQCGRTQSLRCQTPTVRCDRRDIYYGCGDPWCHHLHYGDDFACSGRFSPVLETSEDCASGPTSTCTLSTVRCDHGRNSVPKEFERRRDVSVQTFEMIDKCTSPFLKMGSLKSEKRDCNPKKKFGAYARRRTEPIFQRSQSPSSITPDSLESVKGQHRSLKLGKPEATIKTASTASKPTSTKKPPTVHIDVYCTGTEMESAASNSSDTTENETASTPQTVFESEKVRITHKRADESDIPHNVENLMERNMEKKVEEDTDAYDDSSTTYPSKLSSYSNMKDFSSSISSVPQSWTTYSMSSAALDEYDSVANTSWKDTFSDIDSLLHSRSSIAQTDSLDFVPRKLFEKNASIDETPEIEKDNVLCTPSDSFEYANSEDRLRIKKMEEFWKNKTHTKESKFPYTDQKFLLQQEKIKEYLNKRISDKNIPKNDNKESDSDCSDGSENGWMFVKNDNISQRENKMDDFKTSQINDVESNLKRLSVSSSSSKSPSVIAIQQKLKMDPRLRAPFTIVPGIYTNQRAIAKKFGSIVPVVRKPGHHIGPAKNPDCSCDHCQTHFSNIRSRTRTRSMGDPPAYAPQNFKRYPPTESASNQSVPSQLCNDF